ncbi:hypothetical protein NUG01_000377 [Yersinia enterocolitica]|nr:hypothetical protein [Yersinia enterocolitica]
MGSHSTSTLFCIGLIHHLYVFMIFWLCRHRLSGLDSTGLTEGRVLVVLDDAESNHFQFSYEKYLGLEEPSNNDQKHMDAGEETTMDRTRRLFYVSCTRALKDLAVVLFTANPKQAEAHIRQLDLFEDEAIHTQGVFEMT